jgi:nucleoside-diphosphate-sugar epimerase
MNQRLILVTGATGFIGPHLLQSLLNEGFNIRVATPDKPKLESSQIEWICTDFTNPTNYLDLVRGCKTIYHLAAQLENSDLMYKVNVESSRLLAEAAEQEDCEVFIGVSTVGIYGTPNMRIVDESSSLINQQSRNSFYHVEYNYNYCITKLLSEKAIIASAKKVKYVFPRLSNVVDIVKLKAFFEHSRLTRLWRSPRWTHHIYIEDVIAGFLYLENWARINLSEGEHEIFNLSDGDYLKEHKFRNFYSIDRKQNFSCFAESLTQGIPSLPIKYLDWLKDAVKYRDPFNGISAGYTTYSNKKILETGFVYPKGIKSIYNDLRSGYIM